MECDVAVLGGGPAGYTAAIRAAQLGGKVACIEQEPELGGTCLRVGCIPTKAWVQTAHALHEARETFREARRRRLRAAARLHAGGCLEGRRRQADDRRRRLASSRRSASSGFGATGTVHERHHDRGRGRGGRHVQERDRGHGVVSGAARRYRASTRRGASTRQGSSPRPEVPRRLVVLGGGIIGCEFASIFAHFGSEVTIIEMLPTLIPQEDADAAKELQKAFKQRGIDVQLEKQCTGVEDTGDQLVVQLRRRRDRSRPT